MTGISKRVAVFALGLVSLVQALKPVILADTNRDGRVDVHGDTDIAGKETWTDHAGALFLANIGDTDRRCSANIKAFGSGPTTPEEEVDKCHDASDNVLRNEKYLAPLRTVPIPGLGDSATASVVVVGEEAAEKVRIFHKAGNDWLYVAANYTFTAGDLRAGLELGIDARDVRRPGGWDGRAQVQFTVRDGAETANDSVSLRVAPVLTHHHLQQASEMFSARTGNTSSVSKRFNRELQAHMLKAGIQRPLRMLSGGVFVQDSFEAGYSSIPGTNGPVMLRIMIRSAFDNAEGVVAFSELRSSSVGAVQHLGRENDDTGVDATGNLETIPPYEHCGKSYPAGRAIMGSRAGQKPNIFKFLQAQQVQAPVEIDTTWLYVGHTDEFLQFLPAQNKRGWVMMVDDPLAGLEILQKVQRDGHGETKALSRQSFPTDSQDTVKNTTLPQVTVNDVLSKTNFSRVQDFAARYIDKNIRIIREETGLTDAEIYRVPALYYHEQLTGPRRWQPIKALPDPDEEQKIQSNITTAYGVYALYPGAVNGIVLSNTTYLAPEPWGPKVDGKDVLKEAIIAAYSEAGITVDFIDDYFSHHLGVGEIHCGTNVFRDPVGPWW